MIRPTRVEVDIAAIRANVSALAKLSDADIFAVIKADAYGHGAVEVARALSGDVSHFAVSLIEEAIELREAEITDPILVMGPALANGYGSLVHYDITAMISRQRDLDELAAREPTANVHLKVDTGMGRLGFTPEAAAQIVASKRYAITGLATHFSSADEDDPHDPKSPTNRQLAVFRQFLATVDPSHEYVRHAANSAAILRYPGAYFDAVRPGLALYGNIEGPVRQAMRLCTTIAQLRQVPPNTTVGYGRLWTAPRASRLAVLPIGYADGLPRSRTGKADVLIGGRRVPLVGAISMDISIADVTALGDAAAVGDEVVVLGSQGDEHISVIEFAEQAGLIPYEVTCGISKRVPRHYP